MTDEKPFCCCIFAAWCMGYNEQFQCQRAAQREAELHSQRGLTEYERLSRAGNVSGLRFDANYFHEVISESYLREHIHRQRSASRLVMLLRDCYRKWTGKRP